MLGCFFSVVFVWFLAWFGCWGGFLFVWGVGLSFGVFLMSSLTMCIAAFVFCDWGKIFRISKDHNLNFIHKAKTRKIIICDLTLVLSGNTEYLHPNIFGEEEQRYINFHMEYFHVNWDYSDIAFVAKDYFPCISCVLQMACYVSATLILALFNNQKDTTEYTQEMLNLFSIFLPFVHLTQMRLLCFPQ